MQPPPDGPFMPQALGRAMEESEPLEPGVVRSSAWPRVTRVHVYGKPWDMAAEGYSTEYFSHTGGALRFLKEKCQKRGPKVVPWMVTFLLFYLCFTPACGVMYACGCRLAFSKFGQVETCNIYWPNHPPEQKPCLAYELFERLWLYSCFCLPS